MACNEQEKDPRVQSKAVLLAKAVDFLGASYISQFTACKCPFL